MRQNGFQNGKQTEIQFKLINVSQDAVGNS